MANVMINPLRSFSSVTPNRPASGLLGRVFEDESGNEYKLVQAKATCEKGDVFALDAASSHEGRRASTTSVPAGVCAADMAADEYGFIQISGVNADMLTTASAGELLIPGASGATSAVAISSATAANVVRGVAVTEGTSGAARLVTKR